MKIAVVQFCRLGDIVQTFPVLAALKRDGNSVDLILRHGFHDLPIPDEAADAIHVMPPELEDEVSSESIVRHLQTLSRFCRDLKARRFDVVVNLSHDRESGWLALYLEPGRIVGVSEGRDRNAHARDGWTQYLLSALSNREVGAFNLADVYAHLTATPLAGHNPELRPEESATKSARALLGPRRGRLVGLVPGASDERKRWPAASFAEVGARLAAEGCHVVLLGAPGERELADRVRADSGAPLTNLAGRTSIPVLIAVLRELDLIITNDTGTMHLAAGARTQTLTVTVGPAAVFESAPYAAGHVAVQPEIHCHPCHFASFCADTVCHDLVSPEAVVHLARRQLGGGAESDAPPDPGMRVFRTRFDAVGRLCVHPLRRYPLRAEDFLRPIYRRLWERSLGSAYPMPSEPDVAVELEEQWDVAAGARELERIEALVPRLTRMAATCRDACVVLLDAIHSDSGAAGPMLEQLSRSLLLEGELYPLLRPVTELTSLQLQLAGSRSEGQVLNDMLQTLSSASDRATLFARLVATTLDGLNSAEGVGADRAAPMSMSS